HLERPRDPTALNHDPEFRQLRNAVLGYLTDVREKHRAASRKNAPPPVQLPGLSPIDLRYR
ncbi:MAG: hypothetical protein JWN04_6390, partial [Myxococcaceae bacterium]|nr:hypothetical protein [Myxococcaceae bacterium]